METGVNIRANAIYYGKQKSVSIKTLMKNKYMIAKYSGKRNAFLLQQGCKLLKKVLVGKNSIVVDGSKIPNIMNNYFINITKTLNLKTLKKNEVDIDKFENHISIKKHETFPEIISGSFQFEQVSSDIIRKEIRNLNVKKSSTYGSISAFILKQCVDVYLPYLTVTINCSLKENSFSEELRRSF